MSPKQLILIGGGLSIREGVNGGLWEKLQGRFVIGTNYSYQFFAPTTLCYVDKTFYNENVETLKELPLIIGQGKKLTTKLPNTISMPCTQNYKRDLSEGIYSANLSGIYALSLGIYLLEVGTIFVLGYDFGSITTDLAAHKKTITHFYQDTLTHRGVGKTSWYDKPGRDVRDFGVYLKEDKIKIYNVSPKSKLKVFTKIDYDTFFELLDKEIYDQDLLRKEILEKIKHLPKS
jgi:hypothetical protein